MQVQKIVERVRLAIDEMTAYAGDFANETVDSENLDDVIRDKIPYALIFILENAPEDKLDDTILGTMTSEETSGVTISAGEPVKVKIPDDVVRVLSARLSSWSQSPVPVNESTQEYLMQQDEYARGSWDRPVTAIAYRNKDRYLELYSAKEDTDELLISLVRKPSIGDTSVATTDVSVPVRLEAAFIYQIAGLTMEAFQEQIAGDLFGIATKYLTGISKE